MKLKTYIIQIFSKTKTLDNLVSAMKYFMFEDKRNPLYIHVYETTIFLYTPHDFWNMNSISMMVRSHLRGDYFILYEIDEYDGFLPTTVWEKKKDAVKFYQDRDSVLSKYKRSYMIDKIQRRSFMNDNGVLEPTEKEIDKKVIVEEVKEEVKEKVMTKKPPLKKNKKPTLK